MRPHRLRLTAFGPFPGTVDVDLDEVSAAGPFLLRGATGAGKTSLLDAVGFALFGKVPGSRGLKQLRSDHAAHDVRTSVELWATVSGRAVHVVRTPDQRRPRTRGTGWTTDRATVSLRVARDLAALEADDCDLRLAGVQEANDELAGLVGMTHEQFVQVVLLPQGDFARFLRAKDDERAGVLRALFDTSRFSAVEQHLRTRRDSTRDALAAVQAEVSGAAARVAAHVGQDVPPQDDLPGWAEALHTRSRLAVTEAEGLADTAAAELAAARSEHTVVATRARLCRDLVAVTGTCAELSAGSASVDALAAELHAAERAAEVAARHDAHLAARARAVAALARVTSALAGRPGPWDDPDEPDHLDATAVAGLAKRLDEEVATAQEVGARLEALGRQVERRRRLGEEAVAAEQAVLDARDDVLARRAAAEALPVLVAALVAELDRLRPVAADLSDAEHEVTRWQQVLSRTAALRGLLRGVAGAEAEDLVARAGQREADTRLDELRAARLAGMSAELAATLRTGEACAVCGSTAHPAPARPREDGPVTADDEERARLAAADRARTATRTAAALAGARTGLDAAHTELVAGAAPELTVPLLVHLDDEAADLLRDQVQDRHDLAAARLVAARQAGTAATDAAERLEALREEQVETTRALADAVGAVTGATASRDATLAQVAHLDDELTVALGQAVAEQTPAEVWRERTAATAEQLRRARDAASAANALVPALAELTRSGQEAAACSAAAGWDRLPDAVAAARSRPWCEQARSTVAAHERDLHAATGRRAGIVAELAALAGATDDVPGAEDPAAPLPQVQERLRVAAGAEAELSERVDEADGRCRERHDALSAARVVLQGLDRTVPGLLRTVSGTAPLRREAEAARALADLCTGANDKGIPLSTYVLAAHLEHVVAAANQRLHGMSEGRYALVHVEEGEDRRRRAGLGLAVLDAWTGVQRPAGTLSGGETFLASLALALGLADVVTAEAGGVRIDALFVDEGFGTLDPDSLDRAMDVLDQLQEHGRMVGVVSHVGELRQRLPRQVHVEGGRTGSTVRVLTG